MSQIFVVSDGTGRTAQQALDAALIQFISKDVEIITYPGIRSVEQVHDVVSRAQKAKAFIVHTLVKDNIREELLRSSRILNVETIDLMGPLLNRLSDQLASNPFEQPGIFRHLNESYFRRIETMQFAFNHDDGKRVEELDKAEIVLIGVSRTFKTPLSIFLAFKQWFVANVPIVLNIPVPQILYEIPPERVFCLYTYPNRLAMLRKARQDRFGNTLGNYSDPEFVRRELTYAMQVFESQPEWQRINVTSKSIEEISEEILALLPKRLDDEAL